MKFADFLSSWKGTNQENRFWRLLVPILAVSQLATVGLLYIQDKETILVPPEINEKMQLSRKHASASYKKPWAMFLATTIGNVTPGNVDFLVDNLQMLLSSDVYHQMRQALAEQSESIKRDNLTVVFEPTAVLFEAESGKTFVSGLSYSRGSGGLTSKKTNRVFEVVVDVEAGRPVITSMDTYEGEPHTILWLERKRAKQQQG